MIPRMLVAPARTAWLLPMRRMTVTAVTAATVAVTIGGAAAAASGAHPPAGHSADGFWPACPLPRPGHAQCLVLFRPQIAVNRAVAAGLHGPAAQPRGWSPQAIESAYRLPVAQGSHQTVAVSIAYDTPALGRYLAVYRSHYGLPPCTVASGCLRIVNQDGKPSPLPRSGEVTGWSVEAALDVSMISAACPHCKILVVEGRSDSFADLAATEVTAARLGAAVISNSYGGRESGFSQAYRRAYDRPGHTIVASSGDAGFTAASFPASLATVTAVGGTSCSRAPSQTLKIPVMALPYLGRGLDPSLVHLGALQRAERGGRLPVRLSYRGALPAVPGVTITRSGRGVADGYLTGASARVFGTALRMQFAADHARGSYGSSGLFAGGLSIGLAGAAAPRRERANFPMVTLTVTGSDLAGQPDTGDLVLVFNLDNCTKLDPVSSVNYFCRGAANFSVPAGHYWATVLFSTHRSTARLVVLPQFTVGHSTTVHARERAATNKITITTPRPARPVFNLFNLLRSNHGFTEGASWQFNNGSLRVSPVRHPPALGTLHAYTQAELTSPPGPGTPYTYMLDFPAPPGIIPALRYTARRNGLATVREHYYQNVKPHHILPPGIGLWTTLGGPRPKSPPASRSAW